MTGCWEEAGETACDAAIETPIRQHHPLHAAAALATGDPIRRWVLRDSGGEVLGIAQVGRRRWVGWGDFAVLGRGPIWARTLSHGDRRAQLSDLLDALRRAHRGVMATPDPIAGQDPLRDGPWLEVVTPVSLAWMSLDASTADLRARQSCKWRNRLRRGESSGLVVQHKPWEPDKGHWLLHAESVQRRARGYRGPEDAYTLGWAKVGGPASTRIFTARIDGVTVAAMLFLLHPPGATYHIAWANETGRALAAHPLLLWRAILWLSTHGYTDLDLDVIDTENAPGLARFKLGAGAEVVKLSSTRLWAPGTGLLRRLSSCLSRRAA